MTKAVLVGGGTVSSALDPPQEQTHDVVGESASGLTTYVRQRLQ